MYQLFLDIFKAMFFYAHPFYMILPISLMTIASFILSFSNTTVVVAEPYSRWHEAVLILLVVVVACSSPPSPRRLPSVGSHWKMAGGANDYVVCLQCLICRLTTSSIIWAARQQQTSRWSERPSGLNKKLWHYPETTLIEHTINDTM